MRIAVYLAASALALTANMPVSAQSMNMPGMSMPMPSKAATKKGATKKKPPSNKPAAKKKQSGKKAPIGNPKTAVGQTEHATHTAPNGTPGSIEGMTVSMHQGGAEPLAKPDQHGVMSMPMSGQAAPAQGMSAPMAPQMDHSQMRSMQLQHAGHDMAMTGALGSYPMQREASGTAWQPDTSEHIGLMSMSGDWTLMAHGVLNLVYDHQSGPRGDDMAFASGMLMGMARRPLGNGTVQFKAMLSPDPLMGPRGYPLLLASGETANGRDRLIDRQHPHDFFMELSASLSQNIGPNSSVFLYAGLPGEPAFGPPAFMHREAILDSPEAPISHHWLDSTHISFGVVTVGLALDRVKIEASRFNGREPDQHRWNIETGALDSTALRVSWNPTDTLSVQGSWGHFNNPEQLEPGVDQKRLSASALYAREVAPGWKVAGTLAWGRKTVEHHNDDAFAAEASIKHAAWTVFGRGEMTENRELVVGQEHGPAHRVGKISLGAVRDFRVADHLTIGPGGLVAVDFVPKGLSSFYGSKTPTGAMAFVRLKLN